MHLLNNEADTDFCESTWNRGKHARHAVEKRPGYTEAKIAITEVQRQSGEIDIVRIPTKERRRLNDNLDPKIREYLEWLSTSWEQCFTKELELQPHLPPLSGHQHPGGAHKRVVFDWERVATTQLTGC